LRLFSHKKELKPVKRIVQIDGIDADLRNGLWNVFYEWYWTKTYGSAASL